MDIKGKCVLVTGATGFIGGRLAERLVLEEGVHVRALVRNMAKAQRLKQLGITVVSGDITDTASLRAAMDGCRIVFHTAAWVSEAGHKRDVWTVNVGGTQNLISTAVACGCVERFVHLSSCAVYGSLQQHNISEETPTRMRGDLYGDSKIAAEQVVFGACQEHKLPVVLARASQVYGPNSKQFTIRPVEIIKAGKMVLVDGGRYHCKPVYIDNLVDGLLLCAKVDAAVGLAINFSDGAPVPWHAFFGAYGRMLHIDSFPSVPFRVAWLMALFNETLAGMQGKKSGLNRKAVKTMRSNNSFSNQKARELLGWDPVIDFNEGMKQTEVWLRAKGYLNGL